MPASRRPIAPGCTGVTRRTFLSDMGMGFTGLVLGAMLNRDGVARADAGIPGWSPPDGKPHFTPRAKNVIWLFMIGGASHVESFDPKPELNKYAGKTFQETPYPGVIDSPFLRMQTAVPEVLKFSAETPSVQSLYGLDRPTTQTFGAQCLAARRLVERGVRFVQVFHGSNGGAGAWAAHSDLRATHSALCGQVDRPIAGLLTDLKQRGLLDETVVVWATEFGRTPGGEGTTGRDHHPYGFSVWLAGGGVKGGGTHGATDELGFHAVEGRHYVTDIHSKLGRKPTPFRGGRNAVIPPLPGKERHGKITFMSQRHLKARREDATRDSTTPSGVLNAPVVRR